MFRRERKRRRSCGRSRPDVRTSRLPYSTWTWTTHTAPSWTIPSNRLTTRLSTFPQWWIWGSTHLDAVRVYILIKEPKSQSCYAVCIWTTRMVPSCTISSKQLQHASQLSRSEESEVQHTLMLFVYCRLKIFMVVLLSIVNSTSPLWLIWGSTQMDVVCVYILIKEQRSRSCYSKWTYGSIINDSFQSHTNMPLNFPTVRKLIFNTPCYLFLIRKFCKTS